MIWQIILVFFWGSPIVYCLQKTAEGDYVKGLALLTVVGAYFYADHQYRKEVKESFIKDGLHYDEERDGKGLLESFFEL